MITEERWDVIPNAEPADAFAERARRAVSRITAAHPDQRVAVFAHGGIIGQILAQATGSRPFALGGSDNAAISHLVVSGDQWTLRRFNDTTHLDRGLSVAAAPPT
jgi:probable phosphoglycerate mutase